MTLYSRAGHALPKTNIRDGKPVHVRDRPCTRCGGLGGSEKWRHTGWTCYRCGGNCVDPVRETLKLYTSEQLEKLNDRKAKADAKRAAAKAEKDRVEAERRAAEKAEMISDYQDLLDRIGEELRYGDNEILQNVIETITVRVKDPSDRQIEVVNKIIADRSAERTRRAAAVHVGEIGKREIFDLTLLYTRTEQTGSFPAIYSHWSLFTDANGCKIASTSAPWTLGLHHDADYVYERGQKIRVKATVKAHKTDKKGEPITYIQRPVAA